MSPHKVQTFFPVEWSAKNYTQGKCFLSLVQGRNEIAVCQQMRERFARLAGEVSNYRLLAELFEALRTGAMPSVKAVIAIFR